MAREASRARAEGMLPSPCLPGDPPVRSWRELAACVPRILGALEAVGRLETPEEAVALRDAYERMPAANLSRDLLARRPEALLVLAVRGVGWSDLGDADRVVRALRRFDRKPSWLPTYVRAGAQTLAAARQG